MKIVIVTAGSLGDTAPYIGLGARLKAAGHEVAVAAQSAFEAPIVEAGLEFRRMPGDVRALLASLDGQRMHDARSWVEALPATLRFAKTLLGDVAEGIVEATRGAELLLLHRIVLMHGQLVAHAMGIPFLAFELFPSGLVPTSEFLPAGLRTPSLGRFGNRVVYRLLRAIAEAQRSEDVLHDFHDRLELPHTSPSDLYRRLETERWPVYHAFSRTVVPRPRDWPANAEVVGYFWPHPSQFRAPARLLDFLESGPPPVFVGLGSLVPAESERISALLRDALRRARVRAVVQAGWGRLALDENRDDVLCVGDVPHEWLFPRVKVVVHAAGAGVTAASLRAGVPSVCVPAMNDQFFWADRLKRIGASPGWVQFQDLSPTSLSLMLRGALADPFYARAAQRTGAAVRAEDGAGRIVEVVAQLANRSRAA